MGSTSEARHVVTTHIKVRLAGGEWKPVALFVCQLYAVLNVQDRTILTVTLKVYIVTINEI